jgi:GMP synthase (glutamine-hydrolysing)
MKNVLLIDNHTYYLNNLKELIDKALPSSFLTTIKRDEIADTNLEDYDLIILSGGTGKAVVRSRRFYEPIRNLISEAKIPMIGVCLGAEMIADSFGAELSLMKVKRYRNIPIYFVKQTRIDPGKSPIFVYQAHRWKIRRLPEELECLAVSKDGIEIFRHKSRIVYGLQFHPEVKEPHSDGEDIFLSIVESIKRNLKK